jgi:hypothetical protein
MTPGRHLRGPGPHDVRGCWAGTEEMTEEEWLACDNWETQCTWLTRSGKVSERKRKLFGLSQSRLLWNSFPHDATRREIEVAERHADGEATDEELAAAHQASLERIRATGSISPSDIFPHWGRVERNFFDIVGNLFRLPYRH